MPCVVSSFSFRHGILVDDVQDAIIEDCTMSGVINGIRFNDFASGLVVSGNTITCSEKGIWNPNGSDAAYSIYILDNVVTSTSDDEVNDSAIYVEGGTSGVNLLTAYVRGNIVSAPGIMGIRMHRYLTGGEVVKNIVTATNMCISVRNDSGEAAGGANDVLVEHNIVTAVDSAIGHGILIGVNSTGCTVRHNRVDATKGLLGMVIKGGGTGNDKHVVGPNNHVTGGAVSALLFKGCTGADFDPFSSSFVAGDGDVVQFRDDGAGTSSNNVTFIDSIRDTQGKVTSDGQKVRYP